MSLANVRTFSSFGDGTNTNTTKFKSSHFNKGKNTDYKPEIHSALFMYNDSETALEHSSLTCSMWNKFLKISISKAVFDEASGKYSFAQDTKNKENTISIFLNQSKAMMLLDILMNFKKERNKYSGLGVCAGKSMINIYTGSTFHRDEYDTAIRIIKFNPEDNAVNNTITFQFNRNKYPITTNVSIDENGLIKYDNYLDMCNDIEMDLLIIQLKKFIEAMSYANAYAVYDLMQNKIDFTRNALKSICTTVNAQIPYEKRY